MKKQPDSTAPDFTQCAHWGQGGRFIYDPETGLRTPVVEDAAPAEVEAVPAVAQPVSTKKGK
jgi:hypothetical protein